MGSDRHKTTIPAGGLHQLRRARAPSPTQIRARGVIRGSAGVLLPMNHLVTRFIGAAAAGARPSSQRVLNAVVPDFRVEFQVAAASGVANGAGAAMAATAAGFLHFFVLRCHLHVLLRDFCFCKPQPNTIRLAGPHILIRRNSTLNCSSSLYAGNQR